MINHSDQGSHYVEWALGGFWGSMQQETGLRE